MRLVRWAILAALAVLPVACATPQGEPARDRLSAPATPRVPSIESRAVAFPSSLGVHGGYYARPLVESARPGLILIHEWWGLNDGVKAEAERYARMGFATLAVDLYGGQVATEREQAAALKGAVNDADAVTTMRAAVEWLGRREETRDQPLGCMGWCFGGRKSLQLAIAEPRIRACVVYYGGPVTDPSQLEQIRGSVLGIFGEADASIPMSDVEALRDGLALAGVPNIIKTYPDAGHAFANPTNTSAYKPEAAEDARLVTAKFLAENLGLMAGTPF